MFTKMEEYAKYQMLKRKVKNGIGILKHIGVLIHLPTALEIEKLEKINEIT